MLKSGKSVTRIAPLSRVCAHTQKHTYTHKQLWCVDKLLLHLVLLQPSCVKDPRLYLKMFQSKNLFLQTIIWQQEMTFCWINKIIGSLNWFRVPSAIVQRYCSLKLVCSYDNLAAPNGFCRIDKIISSTNSIRAS